MIEHDDLIDQLRRDRPVTRPADDDGGARLLAQILAEPRSPAGQQARRGWRWRHAAAPATAAAAAALVAGLLAATGGTPSPNTRPPDQTVPRVAVDVQRISATTSSALRTGRAVVAYIGNSGSPMEQRAAGTVSFSGDDLEMRFSFEPVMGRGPGFEIENRTVGGEFYLLDGPPGAQRWYHDTNASGARRTDVFSTDPRTMVAVLAPVAGFLHVDTTDGLRHLRATTLDRLPALNLPLGPVDPKSIARLDVWVGEDDVVRRFDIEQVRRETRPKQPLVVTREQKERMTKETLPAVHPVDMETVEVRDSYAVEVTEYGKPVSITAPPNPTRVAGKG